MVYGSTDTRYNKISYMVANNSASYNGSLWRNRLARSAVNRKVGGSNPPRDDHFYIPLIHKSYCQVRLFA